MYHIKRGPKKKLAPSWRSGGSNPGPSASNDLWRCKADALPLSHIPFISGILMLNITIRLLEWTMIKFRMEAARYPTVLPYLSTGPLLCQDFSPRAECKVAVTPEQKASNNQTVQIFHNYFSFDTNPTARDCCLKMLWDKKDSSCNTKCLKSLVPSSWRRQKIEWPTWITQRFTISTGMEIFLYGVTLPDLP